MYPSGLFLNCTHDQMTILFLNICSFTAMKMGPMAYTMFKCAQHVPKCPTITVPSQYDQMAWLCFHIWSFTAMKMSSMAYKIYQSSFNILPSIKYPPSKKYCQRLWRFWQNGKILQNLVTLCNLALSPFKLGSLLKIQSSLVKLKRQD